MDSASEKLRALDGAMPGTMGELGPFKEIDIAALRNALPLIADVVEAAEKVDDPFLKIALRDLREHLEGGDDGRDD